MKWYVTPANCEFSQWHPQVMAKSIDANVSLPSVEPQDAIVTDGWSILPLTDNGASPGANQVVEARSITVANNAATAEYTYRDKTAEEIEEENNPNNYILNAYQFEKALVILGIDRDTIKPAIAALYSAELIDLDTYADYLARWVQLETIKRDSPVMAVLKPTYSITDEQIDAAWLNAAGITT